MAVTRFGKDFWPFFNKGVIIIIISVQLFVLLVLAAILYFSGIFHSNGTVFIVALSAQTILGLTASLLVYRVVARPMKDLLAAVMHVSGERTDTTPPNPNSTRFEKNGFKDILLTIYELASKRDEALAVTESNETSPSVIPSGHVEKALDETLTGFVTMDNARTITYANKAAPVNVTTEGVTKLSLLFNGQDTLENWLADCEQHAVHAERTWSRIPNKLPEEEGRRFFDVVASYEKGAESEVVLTLIDRTKLYSIGEEELDFIAFAAHELRGPITVIRGYLDVLQDELGPVLQNDQHELFHRLTVSANRLSGYINNILNTSRYDRRHLNLHLSETTVSDIYDTIRDDMQLRATAQNRLLSVAIPKDLPTIAGDPASLGEVFGNLVDNAIKYSNEGGAINVSAAQKGDTIEVLVEDHGIGMPAGVVSNLFQKFYRSHRSRETVAGTGIGLYISKAMVESHGGTISVRSEEGHGSTFIVTLPTYQSIASKLETSDNSNKNLIDQGKGWIKNHSMYRG